MMGSAITHVYRRPPKNSPDAIQWRESSENTFSCLRRCPFVRKLLRRVIIIAATPLLIDNVAAVAAAGGKIA